MVLQQDTDHVLVRLDLTKIQRALKASRKAIVDARGLVMVNSLGRKADPDTKQIMKLLEHLNLEIGLRENTFNKLFERSDSTVESDMTKRAIEFIGDILSSISGVPSARDHRRMLEKMQLLKLDASELQIFMKKTTDTNKAILSSMHFHDGAITANTEQIALAMDRINLQANKATRMLEILNFKTKIDLHMARVDHELQKASNILQDGRLGRVSENSISKNHLAAIIDKIILRQRILRPVFEGQYVSNYFRLDTAHTWAEKESNTIYSLIQVPLADTSEKNAVTVLRPDNILHTDLALAVINKKAGSYRYLSDSDYLKCVDQGVIKMCQKRNIAIQFDRSCEFRNCPKWATIVVHDLTNTEILMILPPNQTAVLACLGEKEKQVYLPSSGICKLNTKCSLVSNLFRIEAYSFNKFTVESDSGFKFEVLAQSDVQAFRPVTQDQIKRLAKNSSDLIDLAFKLNNETVAEMTEFQKNSKARWNNLTKERTSTEQIIIWVGLIANTVIAIILTVQIVTIYCKIAGIRGAIGTSSGKPDNALEKEVGVLTGRVAALESDLLAMRMGLNPCTALAKKEEENEDNESEID